ncbi:MAG: asparagine synthase (glutamine-hydrolyzing) [Desulfurivibrionaceae bacterium]
MCGIAGFFGNPFPREEKESRLAAMMAAIDHRGPDGRGIQIDDGAALGHVRLAIIDLETGRQPMTSADGRFTLIFNGEIYNYRELKKELSGLGYEFRTSSDTEVLLNAWHQWGLDSLKRLNGMYAFALWDKVESKGFLARDPIGIKPLFFNHKNDNFFFGSEVKAILSALPEKPDLDPASLHLLMNFRYLPGDRTMWQGIRQLPPGGLLCWRNGAMEIVNGVSSAAAFKLPEPPVTGEEVADALEHSVTRQLISDVPLGGYLSSGIDSGILTSLASRSGTVHNDCYPTFTIKTGDSPFEATGAARTAEILGVQNFQEEVEIDLREWLPYLIYHLEVPKVNALQSALVARLAAGHVKVALSGLGGDEIFYGYNIHGYMARIARLHNLVPSFLLKSAGKISSGFFSPLGLNYEEWKRGGEALAASSIARTYGILRNIWDCPKERRRLYGPRMLDAELPGAFELLEEMWPQGTGDSVEKAARYEFSQKMINDFLWNEDRVSMARGLEVRVPFLDLELVAAVSDLSRRQLMPGNQLKGLLRRISSRWLPEEVLKRPKSGFQVPAHEFYLDHLRPLIQEYLSPERMKKSGLFNPDFVQNVLKARPHPRLRWHYFTIYLMLGMEIWLDVFTGQNQGKSAEAVNGRRIIKYK